MNRFGFSMRTLAALGIGLASGQALAEHASGNATVSFGEWMTSTPLDRFPNSSPTRTANRFVMGPNHVIIKAGDSVNFIISGLHNIAIYDNGTQPFHINVARTTPTLGTPAGVPIIDDPTNRIYRGLDPSGQPVDRVEVVNFAKPGTYLVICGVLPHFAGGMFGFVQVMPIPSAIVLPPSASRPAEGVKRSSSSRPALGAKKSSSRQDPTR